MWRTLKYPGSCRECRKRRLKCDELKPFCFKCHKNGRKCTGYTDWSQLPVRDMTAWTIKRFQTVEPIPKSGHREQTARLYEVLHIRSRSRPWQASLRPDLLPSGSSRTSIVATPSFLIEDQAMAYLRSEFVDQSPLVFDPGYCHLLQLILRLDKIEDCLSACLSAAALAALSTRPDCRGVEVKAQKAYTSALSTVNLAIQQSNAAEDDQLLASVLLLAFFEIFRCNELTPFCNHILGAASMIKARKTKAISKDLSAQLYSVVKHEFCKLSVIGFGKPADDDLALWLRWRKDASFVADIPIAPKDFKISDSNLNYHTRLMMDYVISKKPIIEVINQYGYPKDAQSTQNFMMAALISMKEAVEKFTEFETTAFVTLGSKPMRLPRPVQRDATFRDAYPRSPILIYKNMYEAIFHMTIWVARVSCMTQLMALASQMKFETGIQSMPAYQAMLYQARDDIEAVVSSTPFVCGWTADGTHIFPNALNATLKHPQSHGTCFAASFITWSLIGTAISPLATEEQKQYLYHMARYLADVRCVRQGEALLDVTAVDTTHLSLARWYQSV